MSLADRTPPTESEYANYRKRFSNWGRWGERDELGTLNHITPEARRAAAALVVEGASVSLSRPIDTHAGPSNPFPAHHMIAVGDSGGLMDYVGLFVHGFANTHVDALCHIPTNDGRHYYNGSPVGPSNLPTTRTGTVEHWRDGIVARGVLYDVPRLRGADYVERGSPVHGWDLVDCAAAQGIEPRAGDAVLVRSGAGRTSRRIRAGTASAAAPACTRRRWNSSSRRMRRCWAGICSTPRRRIRAFRIRWTSRARCTSITLRFPTWVCRCSTTATSRRWRASARGWSAGSSSW